MTPNSELAPRCSSTEPELEKLPISKTYPGKNLLCKSLKESVVFLKIYLIHTYETCDYALGIKLCNAKHRNK